MNEEKRKPVVMTIARRAAELGELGIRMVYASKTDEEGTTRTWYMREDSARRENLTIHETDINIRLMSVEQVQAEKRRARR